MQALFSDFTTLFVVIDPIGTLPLFIALTTGLQDAQRRRMAIAACLISFVILLFFIAAGELLLAALHISVMSFQLAGSIILFLVALSLVFGITLGGGNQPSMNASDAERAVFPLAIPAIAGPGTMLTVVLLTDNVRFSVQEQLLTAAIVGVVLLVTLTLLLLSGPILRLIRKPGIIIVSRVMGLILASLAVEKAVQAIVAIARQS